MKTTKATPEETFEEQAKKYAACSIASIREMIEAMEHARDCDGDCSECDGSGTIPHVDPIDGDGEEETCETCKGTGKCTEGADSDCPENWHDEDSARQRIEEDALSVEVRSDWHTPGDEDANEATEYNILITTGGPAARITGNLDRGQPTSAVFEYQDWFKPWTEVYTGQADASILLQYAQCFYFGE
jgi:hypothetical protein